MYKQIQEVIYFFLSGGECKVCRLSSGLRNLGYVFSEAATRGVP